MKNKFLFFIFLSLFFLQAVSVKASETPGFVFTYHDQKYPVDAQTLASFKGQSVKSRSNIFLNNSLTKQELLSAYLGQPANSFPSLTFYNYKPEKIYQFILNLSEKINKEKIEPKLVIENNKAVDFSAPQNGQELNAYASAFKALDALENGQTASDLVVLEVKPDSSLSQTNNLGITELIASGKSNFKGSPKNRRHNINVGVKKMKGVIVAPNEEFSFNKHLGPVEAEEGFLPELVIKKTGTVPELGGGLCQVSSTTFRAAINAGLPITQRRNHAYAVQYYAPQGTDATIYPGVVDLKFKNDTNGSILIWPYFMDKDNLVFDFYGTKDSRIVDVKKPIQYDRKEDGSMKAEWTRVVIKDGITSTSTFKSIYQSPALFHKEEQFISATPTLSSTLKTN
jgi:vancomycin resistance protein YoaR